MEALKMYSERSKFDVKYVLENCTRDDLYSFIQLNYDKFEHMRDYTKSLIRLGIEINYRRLIYPRMGKELNIPEEEFVLGHLSEESQAFLKTEKEEGDLPETLEGLQEVIQKELDEVLMDLNDYRIHIPGGPFEYLGLHVSPWPTE
jgi:hypothetical protein